MCTTGRWQGDLGRSDNTDNSADNKNKGIPGAWIALAEDQKMYLRWRDEVMFGTYENSEQCAHPGVVPLPQGIDLDGTRDLRFLSTGRL
ncbi:hypothetical protein [Burkholderia gladioli]|nr:hypothetical protein [Burkholderia gladioli]